jgi:hypothetical protein
MGTDFIFFFINYVGYLGGVVWMPILGYLIGQGLESLIFLNKKPVVGGILGALVGLGAWIIFVLPRLDYLF